MWFVFLGIGILLVVSGSVYFQRRLAGALAMVGVGRRGQRVASWLCYYLLFGYLLYAFGNVGLAVALDRDSFTIDPGGVWTWVLVYPFWISVLILLQSLPFILAVDVGLAARRGRIPQAKRTKIVGATVLAVVAGFTVYTPARIVVERDALNVNRYRLGSREGAPFRIVFVGDLQRDEHTGAEETDRLVEDINREKADLVLSGGDWISEGTDFIAAAAAAAGRLESRLGTYSVRGDHEYFAYRDPERSVRELTAALEAEGVDVPDNEVRWFEHQGKRIGVGFLSNNYVVLSTDEQLQAVVGQLASADYSILVTHQLDADLGNKLNGKVDLVLGAHTHGGQVNPWLGFGHVPLARLETPYVVGRYELGATTTAIITAGIGYSVAPFRYASPASFEVLEIRLP